MDEHVECRVRKFRNLAVVKMFFESQMLTESLITRTKLGCWQKVYEPWMLTESFWKLGCWHKDLDLVSVWNANWDLTIKTSSCYSLSCINNLWNAYEVVKNFPSKPRFWKTFWQLDCQIAALFAPMVAWCIQILTILF